MRFVNWISAVPFDSDTLVGVGSTPSWARWLLRFVDFGAVTLIAGVVVCCLFVWPRAWSSGRVRRLALVGVVAGLLAAVIELFIVISDIDDTLDQALETRIGGALGVRLALYLLVGAFMGLSILRRRIRWTAAAVVTLGLIGTWAWSGHARTGRWSGLGVVLDVVHFAAGAAWIGALIVVFLAALRPVNRHGTTDPAGVTSRFGRLTAVAVPLVAVTGIAQTARVSSALEDLVDLTFGRLVLVKVGLLALLLVFANANRRRLQRAAERGAWANEGAAGRLRLNMRRAMGTEFVLGLGVLGVTAALVANPTGIHASGSHIEGYVPAARTTRGADTSSTTTEPTVDSAAPPAGSATSTDGSATPQVVTDSASGTTTVPAGATSQPEDGTVVETTAITETTEAVETTATTATTETTQAVETTEAATTTVPDTTEPVSTSAVETTEVTETTETTAPPSTEAVATSAAAETTEAATTTEPARSTTTEPIGSTTTEPSAATTTSAPVTVRPGPARPWWQVLIDHATAGDATPSTAAVPPSTSEPSATTTTAPCTISETVTIGDQGDDVVCVQQALAAAGYTNSSADGEFGQFTRQAVLAFQDDRGLETDGIVGPRTAEALGIWAG